MKKEGMGRYEVLEVKKKRKKREVQAGPLVH